MSSARKFQCHICGKEYDKQFNFNYHVAHHFNVRPFGCEFAGCMNAYKTKADLRQHQKSHEKSLGMTFPCEQCKINFDSSSKLNVHNRKLHSAKPGWCEQCNRQFTNLKSHINMVHRKIRPYICDLDGKRFAKMHGLVRHIDCVHLGLTPFSCLQCNKSFKEAGSLKNHMKRHASALQNIVSVKSQPNIEDWSSDEEIILEKIRFRCCSCYKSFSSKDSLEKHEHRVHSDAEFTCDLCMQKCVTKRGITNHINNFHILKKKLETVINQKVFKCGVCKKIVKSRSDLDRHKKSQHLEIREFLCEHCSAGFSEHTALVKHLKKHHDIEVEDKEVFSCDLCDRNFQSQYNCEKHVKACEMKRNRRQSVKVKCDVPENEIFLEAECSTVTLQENLDELENLTVKQETAGNSEIFNEHDPFEGEVEIKDEGEMSIKKVIKEEPFIKIEEPDSPQSVSCSLCNEVFLNLQEFSSHLQQSHIEKISRTKSADENHNFQCQVCQQLFSSQQNASDHVILHFNLKPSNETDSVNKFQSTGQPPTETRQKRTEYMRNYRRLLRERESEEETARRRAVHAKKKRFREQKRRDQETQEEASMRRALNAERKRARLQKRRESETEEEAAMRKLVNAQRVREMRKAQRDGETEAEAVERRAAHAQKIRVLRKLKKEGETEEETAMRLATRPILYCDQCGASFIDRRTLKSHTVRYHSGNSGEKVVFRRRKTTIPIACELCDETVFGKNELLAHRLHKHFNFKIQDKHRFFCMICEQILNCRRTALRHHRQVHHEGKILVRTCQECNSQFKLYKDFKNHVENDHKNLQICLICGFSSKSSVDFLSHKKTHRIVSESEKTLACDICGFKAQQKATIDLHMVKVHNLKRKEYHATCEICGEFFNSYQSFHVHRLKHRPRTIYTYSCSHCDKKCYNMRDLKDHEISHTNPGAKPYRCEYPGCFREYFVFRSYQCHIESHRENRNQCKACQTIFSSREKLISHTDEFHPELRRFSCSLCGKTFATNSACLKHTRSCANKTVD